jgi:hypothetical protein
MLFVVIVGVGGGGGGCRRGCGNGSCGVVADLVLSLGKHSLYRSASAFDMNLVISYWYFVIFFE